MGRATDRQHYQRALQYLNAGDWAAAEGVLLQLRQAAGDEDVALADALAYALLMQGDYAACAAVLEPVLVHPQRSFWIAHKYGDALRGLHQPEAAAQVYRQALAEGSTSALTARNLLQVLHELDPDQALVELEGWPQPLAAARLEGAQLAAALVAGLELVGWLQRRGLATPALQRRLLEQRLYGLEPCWEQLATGVTPAEKTASDPDQAWCVALRWRLEQLCLKPAV